MGYENIIICLDQKNIFMTNILNFTKQLEVKAQQEEIDFEDVLTKRKESMDRIDKCNLMIQKNLKEFSSDKEKLLSDVLNGSLTQEQCPTELVELAKLVATYQSLLSRAIELDRIATSVATNRHNDLKTKLAELRNSSGQQNLYHL